MSAQQEASVVYGAISNSDCLLHDAVAHSVIVVDLGFQIAWSNKAFHNCIGVNKHEALGAPLSQFLHLPYSSSPRVCIEDLVQAVLESSPEESPIVRVNSANSAVMHMELFVGEVNVTDQQLILITLTDASAKIAAQEAKYQHPFNAIEAINHVEDGLWDMDLMSKTMVVNPIFEELHGFSGKLNTIQFEDWLESIFNKDQASVIQALDYYLTRPARLKCFEAVYRV